MLAKTLIIPVFLLASCIQVENSKNNPLKSSDNKSYKSLPGTMKIDPKKKYDLSRYAKIDFDRALIKNDKGASFNLSRSSVLKNKTIWFPKTGKTTISLYKNGSPISTEVLR